MFLADAVVETHDRIVGRTYREAARTCEARLGDETAAVREALHAFAELGTALIGARGTGEALDAVIADGPGWEGLGDLVAKAAALANTAVSDPLNHVLGGYSRFRRYTPRMLRTLDIEASPAAEPLLEAVGVLRSDGTAPRIRARTSWPQTTRTAQRAPRPPRGCPPDPLQEARLRRRRRRRGGRGLRFAGRPRFRRLGLQHHDQRGIMRDAAAAGKSPARLMPHVEGGAFDRALAVVVEAQGPRYRLGTGRTASSDGQFFPAAGRGEALNLVNARYGAEPGVKAYSHVSDRFSPFAGS